MIFWERDGRCPKSHTDLRRIGEDSCQERPAMVLEQGTLRFPSQRRLLPQRREPRPSLVGSMASRHPQRGLAATDVPPNKSLPQYIQHVREDLAARLGCAGPLILTCHQASRSICTFWRSPVAENYASAGLSAPERGLGAAPEPFSTRLLKGTGIIESFFPYSGSPPLFKGTRIIESFFGQGEKIKKKLPKANLI